MNQQSQNKIISLLDVLGSTIVDVFYNHMYDRAIAMKEKTEHNITDCYRSAIVDYVKSSDSSEFYKTLVHSIHYYTRISTVYSDLSFVDCLNMYSGLFVPEVYMQSLTEKQKHDILSMVLRESVRSFSNELLSTYLAIIIDEHQDPTNISVLQDVILRELLNHREKSYAKFIQCEQKKKTTAKTATKGIPIQKPKTALSKLTKLYKDVLDEKTKLKQKYNQLQQKYKASCSQAQELHGLLLTQIQLYKNKEAELESYKSNSITNPSKEKMKVANPEYDDIFEISYADE